MSPWKSRWSWVRLVNARDREADPVGAVQRERVRGDLHRAGAVAGVGHPAEGRLQVDRLRRRALDRLLDPADDPLHGSQQARLHADALEDVADQEGGRRLAVGAGDPGDPQLVGRVLVEADRGVRHRRPRVADHRLDHVRLELEPRARPRPRLAPAWTASGANSCPSAVSPGIAKNSVPGPGAPAVVGEARDLDPRVPGDLDHVGAGEQLSKLHPPSRNRCADPLDSGVGYSRPRDVTVGKAQSDAGA